MSVSQTEEFRLKGDFINPAASQLFSYILI